jgi:hypothetical protein
MAATCHHCSCSNPASFLRDKRGLSISIGSILFIGPTFKPGIVTQLNRQLNSLDVLTVSVFGKITLKKQTLTQEDLLSNNREDNSGTIVLTKQKVNKLDEDNQVVLKRLIMKCAEFSICGRCDALYHIGDMLGRKIRDLDICAGSMPGLLMQIRTLKVQKEMLMEKINPKVVVAPVTSKEEESDIDNADEDGDGEGKEETNRMMQFLNDDAQMTTQEKISMKKKILTTTQMIKDKMVRMKMLKRLQRPTVFTCPDCGWLPWSTMEGGGGSESSSSHKK